jgi:hypothetical protein
MKRVICCICFWTLLFSTNPVQGQGSSATTNWNHQWKNALNLTLGFGGMSGSISAGYSRHIGERNRNVYTSYRTGLDIGYAGLFFLGAWYYLNFELTGLTGSGKNHFEFSLGVCGFYERGGYSEENYILPSGSIGYRFQKPNRRFFFRTGVGFPDALYISVGTRF